jgi:glucose-6-phosphate-specific signal transduction histidine kinase
VVAADTSSMRGLPFCDIGSPTLTGSWSARTADGRWVIASALVLAVAIGGLRMLDRSAADAPGVLLIVPVALCAVRFGIRGGVSSATLGLGVAVASSLASEHQLTWVGYGTRAVALVLVGVLVGGFADRGQQLEGELAPHQNLSLDLIATTSFDGLFTTVNRA